MIISINLNKYISGSAWLLKLVSFISICTLVILSPWFFGSWEMWCFWPMAAVIFFASAVGGLGAILGNVVVGITPDIKDPPGYSCEKYIWIFFGSIVPFFLYALWRFSANITRVDIVAMEAERSLLLFITPLLLMLTLFITASPKRLKILFTLFLINSFFLAIYAIINFFVTDNKLILWTVTPFHYGNRATGPFFCPNNFAAYMNLALCFVLAVCLTPGGKWKVKLFSGLVAIPLFIAGFLTLSRGGMASFIAMTPLLLVAGLRGWKWKTRLILTGATCLIVIIAIWSIFHIENPLLTRIRQHSLYKQITKVSENGWEPVKDTFNYGFDRGIYINAALRAWKSEPVCGIGPGQHAIRWYEFAATDDGNRATGKWPRQTNHDFMLYEVHSDWIQMLEEYGAIGLGFFLVPFFTAFVMLFVSQSFALKKHRDAKGTYEKALPLAGILALAVLTIHSIGDFSMQIPSINWTLSIIVACGILSGAKSTASRTSHHHSHSHTHHHHHHHSNSTELEPAKTDGRAMISD